jgi:hypothetical protein
MYKKYQYHVNVQGYEIIKGNTLYTCAYLYLLRIPIGCCLPGVQHIKAVIYNAKY